MRGNREPPDKKTAVPARQPGSAALNIIAANHPHPHRAADTSHSNGADRREGDQTRGGG